MTCRQFMLKYISSAPLTTSFDTISSFPSHVTMEESTMRNLIAALLITSLLLPNMASGDPFKHKADLEIGTVPRLLGNEDIGNISHRGLNFYVDQGKVKLRHGKPDTTWTQLFGFELMSYNNDGVDQSRGLILPEHEFALSLKYPPHSPGGIKLAASYQSFLGDDPFFAHGFYPYYKWEDVEVEIGSEYDVDGSFHYLMSNLKMGEYHVLLAISRESFEEGHGPNVNQVEHNRFGGALRYALIGRWHLIGGANINPSDDGKVTWLGGISHSIDYRANGFNPGLVAVLRVKDQSRYSLTIFTLGGKALGSPVTLVIDQALALGMFKRSRIIGGRYMGDPGLGSAHETVDFGVFVVAISSLSIDVSQDTELMHNDVSAYLSYPDNWGSLNRPYMGFTWAEDSDLIYDYQTHQLGDPRREYWQIKLGARVKVAEHDMRFSLGFDNNGGITVKTTKRF